ncbi:MAG: selD [Segetibacter sp.]|nr:selD [Segetibacter sp.]
MSNDIKLTQFSHGAGCGCKIAPKVLEEILFSEMVMPSSERLLVGNESKDDAAVYDLGDGTAVISTTDFFMPIVDDAFDFGRIASANAISDVYAMGGKPLIAIAVLGWPIDKIPASVAQQVLEGARSICKEAGIPLAGGHSIDTQEPMFGLAVTGIVSTSAIKQNNKAQLGDLLFITKPLGVGVLSTAQKRGVIDPAILPVMVKQMSTLNKIGEELGKIEGVHAMTDVTGFGLLGHSIEMAEGSGFSAELNYDKVNVLPGVKEHIANKVFAGGTTRNLNSYGFKVDYSNTTDETEVSKVLADPQTNGGILVAVQPCFVEQVKELFLKFGLDKFLEPIGQIVEKDEKVVYIK